MAGAFGSPIGLDACSKQQLYMAWGTTMQNAYPYWEHACDNCRFLPAPIVALNNDSDTGMVSSLGVTINSSALPRGTVLGMLEPLAPRTFPITIAAYVAHITAAVELTLSDEIAVAWWTPFADLQWISAEVPETPTRVSAYRLPHAEAQDVVLWGITYRLLDRLFRVAQIAVDPE